MRRTLAAVVAGLAVIVAGCTEPSATPNLSAAQQDVPVTVTRTGSPVTVDSSYLDKKGTGSIKLISSRWLPASAVSGDQRAPRFGAYLIADIEVTGATGTIRYQGMDWAFVDPDGRRYPATGLRDGVGAELGEGYLAVGRKARGYVAIDAPPTAGELSFSGSGDAEQAVWPIRGATDAAASSAPASTR